MVEIKTSRPTIASPTTSGVEYSSRVMIVPVATASTPQPTARGTSVLSFEELEPLVPALEATPSEK